MVRNQMRCCYGAASSKCMRGFMPVDVAELKRRLEEAGVPTALYDLDVDGFSLPSERYCLRTEGAYRWITYYSERGGRTAEHVWLSENDACEYFLQVLLRENERRDRPARPDGKSDA